MLLSLWTRGLSLKRASLVRKLLDIIRSMDWKILIKLFHILSAAWNGKNSLSILKLYKIFPCYVWHQQKHKIGPKTITSPLFCNLYGHCSQRKQKNWWYIQTTSCLDFNFRWWPLSVLTNNSLIRHYDLFPSLSLLRTDISTYRNVLALFSNFNLCASLMEKFGFVLSGYLLLTLDISVLHTLLFIHINSLCFLI